MQVRHVVVLWPPLSSPGVLQILLAFFDGVLEVAFSFQAAIEGLAKAWPSIERSRAEASPFGRPQL